MTGPQLDPITDPTEDDDNAAELDDTEAGPGDALADDYADADPEYTGPCAGGPYHGRVMSSRFPRGFLLVDRPGRHTWLYDFNGTAFHFRTAAPLLEDGRWRAAEEDEFDVIAYDSEQVPK